MIFITLQLFKFRRDQSLYDGLLILFQGPYPRPTLSPTSNAATLPTPVTEIVDATGTLPPLTTPATEPTTTSSTEGTKGVSF